MKVETRLFGIISLFFLVVGVIYWWATYGKEPVGIVALLLTSGFAAMCAIYLGVTGRKTDPRPDDNPDGEISDVQGDYGFFSPHSWWPIVLAFGCALLSFGVAVGWWWIFFSVPILLIGVVGWTFEYFKGPHAI